MVTEEIFIIILNIYDMQDIIVRCALLIYPIAKKYCERKRPMTMIKLNFKLVVTVLAIYLSFQITSKILSQ